jgi:PIF1-like helicase
MRHEVERANGTRLAALKTPPVTFNARDSGSAAPDRRKTVLAGMMVPERLVLKQGAQVMLVKNVDDQRGLVNGAVGRVLGFFAAPRGKSEGVIRNVKLSEDGKSVIFASEGKENVNPTSTASTKAAKREGDKATADAELFPLVEFLTPMGREMALVTRDEFRVEDNEGIILARRVQAGIRFPSALVFSPVNVCVIRFPSSLRGPSLSTRAKVRRYSVSRSISGVCLRKARVMLRCLVLRRWRVCRSSDSIPRRCLPCFRPLSIFYIADARFLAPMQVSAHPKVIEWNKSLESLMK